MVEAKAPGAFADSNLVRPPTYHVGQTVSSCLAKGNHRVNFRRAACWEIASQRGHCQQKQRHDQKHSRMMGAHPIKQTCHHGRCAAEKTNPATMPTPASGPPSVKTF